MTVGARRAAVFTVRWRWIGANGAYIWPRVDGWCRGGGRFALIIVGVLFLAGFTAEILAWMFGALSALRAEVER